MVVHNLKPSHILAGMFFATFIGGLWLIMLGISTWVVVFVPMVISLVFGVFFGLFSLANN